MFRGHQARNRALVLGTVRALGLCKSLLAAWDAASTPLTDRTQWLAVYEAQLPLFARLVLLKRELQRVQGSPKSPAAAKAVAKERKTLYESLKAASTVEPIPSPLFALFGVEASGKARKKRLCRAAWTQDADPLASFALSQALGKKPRPSFVALLKKIELGCDFIPKRH